MNPDEILKKHGLKYEDLTAGERETYLSWLDALSNNQMTVDRVKIYIASMQASLQQEMAKTYETPQDWVGIMALFIPFFGIVRKWYQDQHALYVRARLQNLILLSAFLSSPEKARQALESAIKNIDVKGGEK